MKDKIITVAIWAAGLCLWAWAVAGYFYDWETRGTRLIALGVGLLLMLASRRRT